MPTNESESGPALRLGPSAGIAMRAAVALGSAVGVVDGIATWRRNAYARDFALTCISAPVVLTTISLACIALFLAVLARLRRQQIETWATGVIDQLVLVVVITWGVLWSAGTVAEARQNESGGLIVGLLILPVLLVTVVAGAITRRLLADIEPQQLTRWLNWAALAGAALNGLALIALTSATLAEGRQFLYDDQIGAPWQAGDLNVLLITIDTLRADRVASFGGIEGLTPHLDGLAAEGVAFTNAISQSPWTLPSIASIFTGRPPSRHGAGWSVDGFNLLARTPLAPEVWSFSQALHTCGHATHAVVTNPYLSMHYGLGSGFGGYENVSLESEGFLALRDTGVVRLLLALWPQLLIGDVGETVTGRARVFLQRHRTEKFFLWLHYLDPHAPYGDPHTLGNKSFRSDTLFAGFEATHAGIGSRFDGIARLRAGELHLDNAQRQQLVRLYDAGVRYADEQVGHVLDILDSFGLRDRTIVIVASDHGEEFWEHGGVEHGHTLYDELVRVPLILRWPEGPRGRVVPEVVRLMDVAPTIVDLARCAEPVVQIDGRSLRGLAMGETDYERAALSEGLLLADEKQSLRTAGFKYIRSANGKEELFDLNADPRELRDLAAREDLVAPLRSRMQKSTGDPGVLEKR